ncbi:hypothetical protein B0I35DRAFT_477146 [Stachybotrys elegans]|uniref:Uncharacterized protein n=1 Tax=Stachybotrys elegans TaxID=80388 RepID=A0A8K0SUS5_9HYPO|nr:hypothetical protein B0I35DRAFT_477146 [Stachybotrys elegans]
MDSAQSEVFVLDSSSIPPQVSRSIDSLLRDLIGSALTNDGHAGSSALLRMSHFYNGPMTTALVWVYPAYGPSSLDIEDASEVLDTYLRSPAERRVAPLVLSFKGDEDCGCYVMVATALEASVANSIVDAKSLGLSRSAYGWKLQHSLRKLSLRPYIPSSGLASALDGRVFRGAILIAILISIAFFLLPHDHTNNTSDAPLALGSYVRYPTGESIGPKYQLRIQWHNASEWTHTHPHNNGEWAFRMDDQALVPAHLYDEEEDRYQQWFRQRYPHMTQVADRGDYVRPAWLGSREVAIEWDTSFHDAHCILALRRYFKAKESGRHVCARDINPGHIKHCLDKLDAVHFKPGNMTQHEPKQYMYWQTKVCFGEEEL